MTDDGNTLRLDTVVRRSEDLVHAEVDGEVTMMSAETGRYYGLTKVGTRIWHLLEDATPVGELCQRLRAEFRVEPERCEREVFDFLSAMLDEGLVTKPDDPTSATREDAR